MSLSSWLAFSILCFELPIPLYWFFVHPMAHRWRIHPRRTMLVGFLVAWLPVVACLVIFRYDLLRASIAPKWIWLASAICFVLKSQIFGGWLRDLGVERLTGRAEISGGGFLARHGIYARVRHPRYAGSFLAILGACLLGARPALWIISALWTALMLIVISLEEREMRSRFGAQYEEYAREVPRFLPLWRHSQRRE